MPELSKDALKQLIDLGRQTAGPQAVPEGNTPYVVVPEGCKAQAMPELVWNEHNPHPQRIKQQVKVLDPGSFVSYFQAFSDANSRIFAHEPTVSVKAILDYHAAGEGNAPRWGSHTVTLDLQKSEEWLRWTGSNNKQFTQQAFAEFLEQNAIDVVKPGPAAIMDVASDLQATTEVEFGSAVRQNDGQVRFKYTETTKSSVGAEQLKVPDQFTLSLPVFVGGADIPMQALLRFRVKEGHLVIWYTLVRPEEVIRAAFIAARQQIGDALGVTIINGSM